MRHFVLIITALFFMIQPLPAIQCFDDEETENEEVIILVETNEGTLPGFRGPVFIPVEAYYSNSSSGVNIVFLANIDQYDDRYGDTECRRCINNGCLLSSCYGWLRSVSNRVCHA